MHLLTSANDISSCVCVCVCIAMLHLYVFVKTDHPWIKEDGEAPDTPLDNAVLNRLKQFTAMNQFKKAALRVILFLVI